jgi:COP9 signalosome complex subunit 1
MRIAFSELGKIHYTYGYVNEAIKAWIKSHDFSQQEEDLYTTSYQIAQAAYESQNVSYLMKYSAEADARDKQKNQVKTMIIKILDGMGTLFVDNMKETAIRLANVSIVDDPTIYQVCTPHDIAFYVTLCSLASLDRKELR